ncbi:hypothetical protein SEPCBS57363_005580 [Sporothrix epigloea]|uniref:Flap structure-specific endonuclease n=1 Tax=Sporothrix epigloea TaxID=1892477 RepID=A0ABP0DYC9_9PEZI
MGIKGIYKEIGAGTRVALLRLAVDCLEKRGRLLRLAIDISIWQFQVQAARGGSNPAIRTLFYRLVRLLGMPIQPVFVFDGLNKPLFKRNKRSTGSGDGMATAMAKRMIRMFGFYVHDAPGEAEAECALLQQRGVVDAVLSEDVDTLMFGCSRTLRNWSAATTTSSGKGAATATMTHVSMYETEAAAVTSISPATVLRTKETGLDREGLVLVALMSGGDYLPEGVPGCGVKTACEAAKAGFGRSLCRIKRADAAALAQWRSNLQHELRTNESKYFRTCHHKLVIPESFPNLDILRYYTHPVVSPAEVVGRLRADLDSTDELVPTCLMPEGAAPNLLKPIDVIGLRQFAADTFDWAYRGGAIKFVRVLAPSLMARMLLLKWSADGKIEDSVNNCKNRTNIEDKKLLPTLIEGISRQRAHCSTDETPELRVSFIPITVVGLDLEREVDDPETDFGRDGLALNSDDEFNEPTRTALQSSASGYNAGNLTVASARKLATAAPYDPTVADVTWIPQTIVGIGALSTLTEWDRKQQQGKKGSMAKMSEGTKTARKPKAASKIDKSSMQPGALDRFVRITKLASEATTITSGTKAVATTATDTPVISESAYNIQKNSAPDEKSGPERETLQQSEDYDLPEIPRGKTSQRKTASNARSMQAAPRRKGGNPWILTGAQEVPFVTKSTISGLADQKREYNRPATPKSAARKVCAMSSQVEDVISLSSSSPFPAASSQAVEFPISPNTSSPPPTSCPSLHVAPLSPSKRRTTASIKKTTRPGSRVKYQAPNQTSSPQKQSSILSFFSSQTMAAPSSPSKAPVAILLSDDDEPSTDNWRPRTDPEDDVFLSSSLPILEFQTAKTPRVKLSSAETTTLKKTTETVSKQRTTYAPRKSAVGYFREEVVDLEAVETTSSPPARSRRVWRHSEIGVVDLTQEGL